MDPGKPIDSSNWFFVAANGDRVVINGALRPVLDRDQALNLAAWLVAIADPDGDRFPELLATIRRG